MIQHIIILILAAFGALNVVFWALLMIGMRLGKKAEQKELQYYKAKKLKKMLETQNLN